MISGKLQNERYDDEKAIFDKIDGILTGRMGEKTTFDWKNCLTKGESLFVLYKERKSKRQKVEEGIEVFIHINVISFFFEHQKVFQIFLKQRFLSKTF